MIYLLLSTLLTGGFCEMSALPAARFERYTSPYPYSFTWQVFKNDLTNINNSIWTFLPSSSFISSNLVSIKNYNTGSSFSSEDLSRLNVSGTVWASNVDSLKNWILQNSIMSAATMLEMFIKYGAMTAIHSRPELIDRRMLGIDGISILKDPAKKTKEFDGILKQSIKGMTQGDWSSRMLNMSVCLGSLPEKVEEKQSDLRKFQKIRNKIAHEQGVEDQKIEFVPWRNPEKVEISHQDVKDFLSIVKLVAEELDKNVFQKHIGCYDIIREYHHWIFREKKSPNERSAKEYKAYLGQSFGTIPSSEFFKDMAAYYNQC
ncbi:hypothetical protein ACIU1J_21470 [Azospirillum doebereinerae]|uniref:hypothetical protein n=1 Tax=Azospirillum doebereinerae TaxID=92933 RepID=UPI001EE60319|nr:hypothetical protein [Azospirillum doebereinerae]MCG5242385.1 hypothetical protein [Azospirillum doebereinerae]